MTELRPDGLDGVVFLRRDALAAWDVATRRSLPAVRDGDWVPGATWRVRRPATVGRRCLAPKIGTASWPARCCVTAQTAVVLSSRLRAIEYGGPSCGASTYRRRAPHAGSTARAGRKEAGVGSTEVCSSRGRGHAQRRRGRPRPTRTLIDVTHDVPTSSAALVVANSLLHSAPDDTRGCRDTGTPSMQHRGRTRSATDLVLASRRSAGSSRWARLARSSCAGASGSRPRAAVEVLTTSSVMSFARVDFAVAGVRGLRLEFDGRVKYTKFRREGESVSTQCCCEKRSARRRSAELTGWVCIRITWDDLAHPDRLAARDPRSPSTPPSTAGLSQRSGRSCTCQALQRPGHPKRSPARPGIAHSTYDTGRFS